MQKKKKLSRKFFAPPPSDLKKFQGPPFAMQITGPLHRKACKLNFYRGNFFQDPLKETSSLCVLFFF